MYHISKVKEKSIFFLKNIHGRNVLQDECFGDLYDIVLMVYPTVCNIITGCMSYHSIYVTPQYVIPSQDVCNTTVCM